MVKRMDTKLAIVCTHPIQYYAPVFKILSQKINLKVFYTKHTVFDKGFQQRIEWDIPLLEGYEYISAGKLVTKKIVNLGLTIFSSMAGQIFIIY